MQYLCFRTLSYVPKFINKIAPRSAARVAIRYKIRRTPYITLTISQTHLPFSGR